MGDLRHVRTKLVGVTFANDDGSSRQSLIARCRAGEPLTLRHEPDNPADDHAVAVYNAAGEQLGHRRRKLAREVVEEARGGTIWAAYVSEVTGGYGFKRSLGCNIVLVAAEPGVDEAEVPRYAREILGAEEARVWVGPEASVVEYKRADEKRLKWPLTEYLKPSPSRPRRARPASQPPDRSGVLIWRVIVMAAILAAAVLISLALVSGAPVGPADAGSLVTDRAVVDGLAGVLEHGPHRLGPPPAAELRGNALRVEFGGNPAVARAGRPPVSDHLQHGLLGTQHAQRAAVIGQGPPEGDLAGAARSQGCCQARSAMSSARTLT